MTLKGILALISRYFAKFYKPITSKWSKISYMMSTMQKM